MKTFKRILGMILCFCTVSFPTIKAEDNNNLLVNGDFEQGIYGWNGSKTSSNNGDFSVQSEVAHSGKALSITYITGSPFASQIVTVEPCAQYEISAYVKTDANTQATIEFEGSGFDTDIEVVPKGTTTWKKITATITMPVAASRLIIMPRIYGSGTAYFDDITFKLIKEAPKLSLETDQIFYYSDLETGTATSHLLGDAVETYKDGTVAFSFKVGAWPIGSPSEKIPFTDGKASYTFSISERLQVEKEEVTLTATLYDSSGAKVEENSISIYRWNRPRNLGADGIYRYNGEPFYPVIGYHVNNLEDAIKAKEAGINVVQAGTGMIDALQKVLDEQGIDLGIRVLVPLYGTENGVLTPAGAPSREEKTKTAVRKYKDSRFVFAWATMDEAFHMMTDVEPHLLNGYKIIREIDATHPVYNCETLESTFTRAQKYVDILANDPYITDGMNESALTHVYNRMLKVQKATESSKKATCAILQAYKSGSYVPSGKDLRHTIYQAVAAGTDMIGYYALSDGMGKDENGADIALWDQQAGAPDLWNGMVEFGQNEKEKVLLHLTQRDENDIPLTKNGNLQYYGATVGDRMYVVLMNQSVTDSLDVEAFAAKAANGLARVPSMRLAPNEAKLLDLPRVTYMSMNGTEATITVDGFVAEYSAANQLLNLYKKNDTFTVAETSIFKWFHWDSLLRPIKSE